MDRSQVRFAEPNILLENVGGSFRDVSREAGPGLEVVKVSHGVATGDLEGRVRFYEQLFAADLSQSKRNGGKYPFYADAWLLVKLSAGFQRFSCFSLVAHEGS